ncbi:MAG: hypothetical protein H6581_10700 [Bacteroidia bacterium]|nr:hypothetical protein [Bacteroidia bacterium]
MSKITVIPSNSDLISNQLAYFFEIIQKIEGLILEEESEIELDFGNCGWAAPFFLLPISCFIDKIEGRNVKIILTPPQNQNSKAYFNTVKFPAGLDPSVNPDWEVDLNQFGPKSYLPIIKFPCRGVGSTNQREKLLSGTMRLLKSQLNLSQDITGGISYLISEITDNIIEHSQAINGWMMGQHFRSKGYLDLCISDSGISLLGSYQKAERLAITTHREAILSALSGISTKYDGIQRGYGIPTTLKLLTEGLGGVFMLWSGDAIYVKGKNKDQLVVENIYQTKTFWEGTIVIFRIPDYKGGKFNIHKYVI